MKLVIITKTKSDYEGYRSEIDNRFNSLAAILEKYGVPVAHPSEDVTRLFLIDDTQFLVALSSADPVKPTTPILVFSLTSPEGSEALAGSPCLDHWAFRLPASADPPSNPEEPQSPRPEKLSDPSVQQGSLDDQTGFNKTNRRT